MRKSRRTGPVSQGTYLSNCNPATNMSQAGHEGPPTVSTFQSVLSASKNIAS